MPLRSLRWIRPSAGASWARADGATATVAVAAAVVVMNARRFISYGAVMTLPLELDDSRLVASHHASWTGASRQSSLPQRPQRGHRDRAGFDVTTGGPPNHRGASRMAIATTRYVSECSRHRH